MRESFSFTVLGLLLTLIAGPAGINRVAASPWMNLFLTTLFVVFALNLFGMFEIRLPSGLLSKLDSRAQGGSSLVATLLMGLTFTLTSFTCTAPFSARCWLRQRKVTGSGGYRNVCVRNCVRVAILLAGVVSAVASLMPKSGGWLNSVKVVMGFLEIAAAFKFLVSIRLGMADRIPNTGAGCLGGAGDRHGNLPAGQDTIALRHQSRTARVVRLPSATFFLGLAFYLLTGLFGGKLGELDAFLPPDSAAPTVGFGVGAASNGATGRLIPAKWIESYDDGLAKAKAEKKPMFLNFTGVTCTNCRWMEQNMFPLPDVKKELDRFVLGELFTDRETAEAKETGRCLKRVSRQWRCRFT